MNYYKEQKKRDKKAGYKFKYVDIEGNVVVIKMHREITRDELILNFQNFIKACGYHIDDMSLELVDVPRASSTIVQDVIEIPHDSFSDHELRTLKDKINWIMKQRIDGELELETAHPSFVEEFQAVKVEEEIKHKAKSLKARFEANKYKKDYIADNGGM